jgi:hypothetical protein
MADWLFFFELGSMIWFAGSAPAGGLACGSFCGKEGLR